MDKKEYFELYKMYEMRAKTVVKMLESRLAIVSRPDYQSSALRSITHGPVDGYMERSFDKHVVNFT